MLKEELTKLMRDFREALNNEDLEKVLSYLAQDADWIHPTANLRVRKRSGNF